MFNIFSYIKYSSRVILLIYLVSKIKKIKKQLSCIYR